MAAGKAAHCPCLYHTIAQKAIAQCAEVRAPRPGAPPAPVASPSHPAAPLDVAALAATWPRQAITSLAPLVRGEGRGEGRFRARTGVSGEPRPYRSIGDWRMNLKPQSCRPRMRVHNANSADVSVRRNAPSLSLKRLAPHPSPLPASEAREDTLCTPRSFPRPQDKRSTNAIFQGPRS